MREMIVYFVKCDEKPKCSAFITSRKRQFEKFRKIELLDSSILVHVSENVICQAQRDVSSSLFSMFYFPRRLTI